MRELLVQVSIRRRADNTPVQTLLGSAWASQDIWGTACYAEPEDPEYGVWLMETPPTFVIELHKAGFARAVGIQYIIEAEMP